MSICFVYSHTPPYKVFGLANVNNKCNNNNVNIFKKFKTSKNTFITNGLHIISTALILNLVHQYLI